MLLALVGCTSPTEKEANEKAITSIHKNENTPFVEDNAKVLSKETYKYIENLNHDLSKTKEKPQILVVTIKDLAGHDIAEVATEKGKQYGIGSKDSNNGLVYVVSVDDREDFLATGYGMESIITDSMAADMLDNDTSHDAYSDSKYDKGVVHNLKQITPYVSGVKTIKEYEEQHARDKRKELIILVIAIVVVLALAILLGVADGGSSGYSGSSGSSRGWGGGFGGGGGGSSW